MSASLSSRIAELSQAQANLGVSAAAIQRDFRLVLDAYRNANISVRTTEPPKYFLSVPSLQAVDSSAAEPVKASLSRVQSDLKSASESHHAPLHDALRAIQEEGTSMLATRIPQLFREIESEAQNEINRLTPTLERTVPRG